MRLFSLIAIILTIWSLPLHATDAEGLFASGLQRFQESKFQEAKDLFEQSLQIAPNSTPILYNLGLAEYRLGKAGLAIAFWRKAQFLGGDDSSVAEALSFALSKLPKKDLPAKPDLFETLRSQFLVEFNLSASLAFMAAALGLFGLSLLRWAGQVKRSKDLDSPRPSMGWKLPLSSLFFVLALTTTALKVFERAQTRGTIVLKSAEVRATPEENSPSLFEIYEGLEVLVLERRETWLRVRYPGGRSGWLQDVALMQTAGRAL